MGKIYDKLWSHLLVNEFSSLKQGPTGWGSGVDVTFLPEKITQCPNA